MKEDGNIEMEVMKWEWTLEERNDGVGEEPAKTGL